MNNHKTKTKNMDELKDDLSAQLDALKFQLNLQRYPPRFFDRIQARDDAVEIIENMQKLTLTLPTTRRGFTL